MDIKLFHNPGELTLGQFDMKRTGLILVTDDTLETAVIISLFTDRRARPDDELPGIDDSRRGWWGDSLSDIEGDETGSWLWLLYREKTTDETLSRAREYCLAALQWLLEDRIAESVNVKTWYQDQTAGLMIIEVVIIKLDGSQERYNLLWKQLYPNYQEPALYTWRNALLDEAGSPLMTESNEGLLLE
jgi:phage gp46-like protein